jgi:3-oxoacyl-[acyl-carrier protein] reductase
MRKKALITGASRGIGVAIATRLAKEGFDLVLTARDLNGLKATQAACQEWTEKVQVIPTDLTSEPEVLVLFDEVGNLDLLVNNAGMGIFGAITEFALEDWQQVQRLNVEGAFLCMREAMRRMKQQNGGRIINIASVVGVKGYPNQAAYGASKHALLGLTKTAIEEGRDTNIRVHAICPGGVATEMLRQSRPDLDDFSKMIQPEDVAEAVAYLVRLPVQITVDVLHLRRSASPQTWG